MHRNNSIFVLSVCWTVRMRKRAAFNCNIMLLLLLCIDSISAEYTIFHCGCIGAMLCLTIPYHSKPIFNYVNSDSHAFPCRLSFINYSEMASKLRGEKDESQVKYICTQNKFFPISCVHMLHQSLTQSDQTRDGYQTHCIMSFYRLRNAKSQKEILK